MPEFGRAAAALWAADFAIHGTDSYSSLLFG